MKSIRIKKDSLVSTNSQFEQSQNCIAVERSKEQVGKWNAVLNGVTITSVPVSFETACRRANCNKYRNVQ